MKPKHLLLVIVAGPVLSGCPQQSISQSPPTAAGPCNGAACNITIRVDNCVPAPSIDPIPVGSTPNVVINWRISNPPGDGYTFHPTNGIVPDNSGQQFSGHTAASPTHFHVNDKNSDAKKYKYAINVHRNGSPCPTLDPFIKNGAN